MYQIASHFGLHNVFLYCQLIWKHSRQILWCCHCTLQLCVSRFVLWLIFLIYLLFLPVIESLTESLRGELNTRLENIFSYWHWNNPSLSKSTLGILKVAELVSDVWVFLNEPEGFCSVNVPPKNPVEIEHVMPTSWPQDTSPRGFMEMPGFGKLTEKAAQY